MTASAVDRLDLSEVNVPRGALMRMYLEAADTVTGPIRLPITIIRGKEIGPTLTISAACHPGEYNGIMASVELARTIEPEQLSGTLIIVHVQNVPGVQGKVGHFNPIDGVNMGTAFADDRRVIEGQGSVSHQARSPSHQIAEALFENTVRPADAFIDLHGGEFFEFVPPNIEYFVTGQESVDNATRQLASAFGFRLLWEVPQGSIPEMPSYPGRGSCVMEAGVAGIPAVLCEVGGEGRIDRGLVAETVDGVARAMSYLGMIEEPPIATFDAQTTLVGGHVLFAERAGLFLSAVAPGEAVVSGQKLGHLVNLAGDVVQELHAPQAAVLTNVVTRGIANPGDMLFVMGNLADIETTS